MHTKTRTLTEIWVGSSHDGGQTGSSGPDFNHSVHFGRSLNALNFWCSSFHSQCAFWRVSESIKQALRLESGLEVRQLGSRRLPAAQISVAVCTFEGL